MEEIITAKVVSLSRPYLTKEGNSWISDVVYVKNDNYFTKKAVAPVYRHGPFEIGEEVEVDFDLNDNPAEDWMIEIYQTPSRYKEILYDKKQIEKREEQKEVAKKEVFTFKTLLKVILTILFVAVFGMLFLIITGKI